jgi:hypothetical protein
MIVVKALKYSLLAGLLLLGGCVSVPQGPSVMALPGSSKDFGQFRFDDQECRQFANLQVNGSNPGQAANESMVTSAAVGTAVGALAGAAMGGSSGAGVGAGLGLVTGAMVGSGTGYASGYAAQQRYDNAYVQCMYAKNNKVPVRGRFETRQGGQAVAAVPPRQSPAVVTPSLPPPGTPYPPPPPGYR